MAMADQIWPPGLEFDPYVTERGVVLFEPLKSWAAEFVS